MKIQLRQLYTTSANQKLMSPVVSLSSAGPTPQLTLPQVKSSNQLGKAIAGDQKQY